MRKVEAEIGVAVKNMYSDPTNINNQRAFHAALEKRAHATSATTTMLNFIHNSRRTILNSF